MIFLSKIVRMVGLNDYFPGEEPLPNEIRGDNYNPSEPEPPIVDLFSTGQIVG